MGRRHHRHRARGILAVTALSGLIVATVATPATAETDRANGYYIDPGQQHAGNPDGGREWLGTFQVDGEPVFCVDYQLKAPETDERYEPGDELLTKWGDEIPAARAAKISYLLLRYGNTDDDDTAGAVAHLLHSWTADPDYDGGELGSDVAAPEVAYDIDFHTGAMSDGQLERVEELDAEAEEFRGPWNVELTAPEHDQEIGTSDQWSLVVETASGVGVPDIPVTVELTGGQVTTGDNVDDASDDAAEKTGEKDDDDNDVTVQNDRAASQDDNVSGQDVSGQDDSVADETTVSTGEDGTATVDVVPTAEEVTVQLDLRAPAAQPRVQEPIDDEIQTVVATGGEQELNAEEHLTAQPRPPETETSTTTVEVPRTIPAGGHPDAVVQGETTTAIPMGAIVGTGALVLLGSMLTGWIARRRFGGR